MLDFFLHQTSISVRKQPKTKILIFFLIHHFYFSKISWPPSDCSWQISPWLNKAPKMPSISCLVVTGFFFNFYCWHYYRCPHSLLLCLPSLIPQPPSLWPSPHCCWTYELCIYVLCLIPSPSFIPYLLSPPFWQLSFCSTCPWL